MCGHLIRLQPENLTMVKSVFLGMKGTSHGHRAKVNTLVQSELSSLVKSGSGSPRKLNNVWIEEYYNCFNLTSQSMTLKGCF